MRTIAYLQQSSNPQHDRTKKEELVNYSYDRLFTEPVWTRTKGEQLNKALRELQDQDHFLVYSIQDLQMDLIQVNQLFQYFQLRQITFQSVSDSLHTCSPAGQRFLFNLQRLAARELSSKTIQRM